MLANIHHRVLIQHELEKKLLFRLLRYAKTVHFFLLVQQLDKDVILVILHDHQLAIVYPTVGYYSVSVNATKWC